MACESKAKNEENCPCPETHCARHGVCCKCIAYHRSSKSWPEPACLR